MIDAKIYGNDLVIRVREEQDGQTLPDLLQISAKTGYLLQQEKRLILNGSPVKALEILHTGDKLTVHLPEGAIDYTPAQKSCRIVYEDDFLYIAHKDAGIIVHDGFDNTDTFAAQAAAFQLQNNIQSPVRYIHRLDKETSGLMIFIKHPLFQPLFENMLRNRDIHRTYLAVCWGKTRPGQKYHWTLPIGKDRHVNGKYIVSDTGKDAETNAVCILRKHPFIILKCELQTGRTHQIRVHTSHAGLPIVDDPIYGRKAREFHRMGLYAYEIRFTHPFTGESITVRDRLDKDLRIFPDLPEALGQYSL
ncbi:MAG: RluA family pseudouridine synthase [Solobacterium sp.]|nr:RluA family pseudouridine synthase [Solobacterium sp.]